MAWRDVAWVVYLIRAFEGFGQSLMGLGLKVMLGLTCYRRLARRGGVKRISMNIYDDIRAVVKERLELVGLRRDVIHLVRC